MLPSDQKEAWHEPKEAARTFPVCLCAAWAVTVFLGMAIWWVA